MRFVEKTGKTVDDAITAALVELGLPSDQVEIEVISEGSKGVLGIFGTKEAKVRVTAKVSSIEEEIFKSEEKAPVQKAVEIKKKETPVVKKEAAPVKAVEKAVEKPVEKKVEKAPVKNEVKVEKPVVKNNPEKKEAQPDPKKVPEVAEKQNFVMESLVEDRLRAAKEAREKKVEEAALPSEPIEFSEDAKKAQQAAIDFLKPVLHQMGIEAEITGKMEEKDVLSLDIAGENLGMIIGKRGNTLDSLQYLTVLVANKATDEHIKIKLDAENYREKRKETLEKLAINLAKKARKTNRRVALEPMNPYERRIIHSALQSFNGVETHSEGEDPFRKVIISPVKGNYHRH